MTVIEKMARAIATHKNMPEAYRAEAWEILCKEHPKMADNYRSDARTALKALEPTMAMVEAGWECIPDYDADHDAAKTIFNAMKQAALEEGE